MKYHKLACWWIGVGLEVARKTANSPNESPETRERCLRQIEKLTEAHDVLARDSERREREEAHGQNQGHAL